MAERRPGAGDPLPEWLGADQREHPRPEFRAELRQRLVAGPPVGAAPPRVPTPRFVAGTVAAVGIALLAAVTWVLVRPAPDAVLDGPAIATMPIVSGGQVVPGTEDAASSVSPIKASSTEALPTATTKLPSSTPTEPSTITPEAVGLSFPATATGVLPTRAVVAGSGETGQGSGPSSPPHDPSATPNDAPEQTPVPVQTGAATATGTPPVTPPATPTSVMGMLPDTPTPAPTGQGWPTLPAPGTPTPSADTASD